MKPRLGFLGVGWIGKQRMHEIAKSGLADIVAIADSQPTALAEASAVVSNAMALASYDALLEQPLDGIVIATPSALHAEQSIRALQRGFAVFCQKPLGRTAAETKSVIDAAALADRRLGVDFSYRHTAALNAVRNVVRSGELGTIYAVDVVFHNAYGPDKPWFYDRELAGGGCVVDLGSHLIDAALWILGFPRVHRVASSVFAAGARITADSKAVEDYAVARLDLESGAVVQLSCSWKLSAGQDAVIGASFYGTQGGVAMHNVGGSFYDFAAVRYNGRSRETLVSGTDAWGGRAAVNWCQQLGISRSFDGSATELMHVAQVIDVIYAAAGAPRLS